MLNPKPIRAVVFDLDGLMFNTEDIFNEVGHRAMERRGKKMTDELLGMMMGRRAPEAMQICIDYHQLNDTIEGLIHETREMFREIAEEHLSPMPGLLTLLDHIETHQLPKGVATSSGRKYLDEILTRFQLHERFHLTLTAEDVTHGKPHPEIYLKAATNLGIQPDEMLVLEDSHTGTTAAVQAGAIAVSVPNRHSRRFDFSHATYVAQSLDEPWILERLAMR